ncbi:hypothetical protein [Streptomyces sp. NPDC101393]
MRGRGEDGHVAYSVFVRLAGASSASIRTYWWNPDLMRRPD